MHPPDHAEARRLLAEIAAQEQQLAELRQIREQLLQDIAYLKGKEDGRNLALNQQ